MKTGYLLLIVILTLSAPAGALAQDPTSLEYPYIYKSTRAMGMGGAYTAVGGRTDTLFYNPAGLINIPRDKGWEVNLINVSLENSDKMAKMSSLLTKQECGDDTLCQDLQDALDSDVNATDEEQAIAVNEVLANYRGQNLHLRVADFTSIGKSFEKWAFGIGVVGSGRFDVMTHQGFGEEGLLEVNSDVTYGPIGGFSMEMKENLIAGVGLKVLHRESLVHKFTARELAEKQDDLDDFIMNELQETGDGIGFDAGVIWRFAPDSKLRPSLGVSLLNIGDLDFGDAGKLPMTLNTGVSVNPEVSWAHSLIAGVDFIDVLNGYKQDKDMAKRLRYGAELQLFDIMPFELAVRAGMYNEAPTFGFDVRVLIVSVSYAMYTEEIGAFAGQDKDKRQLLTLNVGW
jgi:hypothetical protein